MNAPTRILLALLGCLVFGGNALAAELGHCDPICCDEPCESAPLVPEDCACCATRGTAEADPMLPATAPPAPMPAALPAVPDLPAPTAPARPTGFAPTSAPLPAPPRPTVLRL